MARFAYSGLTSDGKKARGEIDAKGPTEARDLLIARSVTPVSIRLAAKSLFSGSDALTDREASEISRDLSRFLKAGLPLVASIRALAVSGYSRKTRTLLEAAAREMETGIPLSDILFQQKGRVVHGLAGVVRVGEKTGRLGDALEDAARSFSLAAGFREQVSGALAYPALILTMVIGALVVFVTYVLPNLRPLFEGPGVKTPENIALLFRIADALNLVGPAVIVVILCVILLLALLPNFRRLAQSTLETLSFSKVAMGLSGLIVYAGIARRLSLGLSAGVTAPDALANAAAASSYQTVRAAGEKAVQQLSAGISLSRAISTLPGVPESFVNLARAGETAGRIAPAIREAADLLEQSARSRTDRMVALLAPAITIFTGAIVGLVVVTIFSGLTGIADGILE